MNESNLPLEQFYSNEINFKDEIYMRQPINSEWKTYTWHEIGQEARILATAIKNMNFEEKSCIAIMSKNCAHWIITDLAIWMAGHIAVPLYPTLASATINQILTHSESKLVFIGKLDDWESQMSGIPDNISKVEFPFWKNNGCQPFADFVEGSRPLENNSNIKADDVATIIYTSGTTGTSKGVVHTFDSISFPMKEAKKRIDLNENDKFLSYLPLAHIAERLLIEIGSIYSKGEVTFVESLDTFASTLQETEPTVFLAVPRIWTKFQHGVLKKIPQNKLNLLLIIPIIGNIIKKKIRTQLGLNNVRIPLTGAAPISKDLLKWFDKIGINILEVYGMTENFAFATFNFPNCYKYGSVGKSWEKGEIQIGPNEEIMTRSRGTMKGYYKQPEKTNEVLNQEGWLMTGDQGAFDEEGFLSITGRVKDLFKTAKGKYISPNLIEKHFAMNSLIEHVCVVGSGMAYPIALVTLSEIGQAGRNEVIEKSFRLLLDEVNSKVEKFERLKNIVVIKDEWSVENEVLTPTLKIKRNLIEKNYHLATESWSESSLPVIFQ